MARVGQALNEYADHAKKDLGLPANMPRPYCLAGVWAGIATNQNQSQNGKVHVNFDDYAFGFNTIVMGVKSEGAGDGD
ncbi:hypothetical protein MMC20_008133 [Loxospora ochrophaea]|nr:hypothetical protein [Loxospora ochrophaea]